VQGLRRGEVFGLIHQDEPPFGGGQLQDPLNILAALYHGEIVVILTGEICLLDEFVGPLCVHEGQAPEIQDNVTYRTGLRFEVIGHIRDLRPCAKV